MIGCRRPGGVALGGGPGQCDLEAFFEKNTGVFTQRSHPGRRQGGAGIRLQRLEKQPQLFDGAAERSRDGLAGGPRDHLRDLLQLQPELCQAVRGKGPHRLGRRRRRGRFSSRRNERQAQLALGVDHLHRQFIAGGHREADLGESPEVSEIHQRAVILAHVDHLQSQQIAGPQGHLLAEQLLGPGVQRNAYEGSDFHAPLTREFPGRARRAVETPQRPDV